MASKREKPIEKQAAEFVIFHLADRSAFAPFTGTDSAAWRAFLPLVQLWGRTRHPDIVTAMRIVVHTAQTRHADVMAIFKKSIPCLLDWSDEPKLWAQIAPGSPVDPLCPLWPCADGARICSHIHSKRSKKRPGWFVCKDPTCRDEWRPEPASHYPEPT